MEKKSTLELTSWVHSSLSISGLAAINISAIAGVEPMLEHHAFTEATITIGLITAALIFLSSPFIRLILLICHSAILHSLAQKLIG